MNKKLLTLAIPSIVLSLSSCGYNTMDWPRISFSFTADDVIETRMYFHQKANRYVEEIKDSRVSEKKNLRKALLAL